MLIDFGLAEEVGQSDGSNRKILILCDWWSVGNLLYEMLFGHVSACTLYMLLALNLDVVSMHRLINI